MTTPTERDIKRARELAKYCDRFALAETAEKAFAVLDLAELAIARALAEERAEVDRPGIYCRNNHKPIWHPRWEPCPMCEAAQSYQELLMAVASKFPGETRHETALRYIRNAERSVNTPAKQPLPTPPEEK